MHTSESKDSQLPLFDERQTVPETNVTDYSLREASQAAEASPETLVYDRLREHLANRDAWIDQQCDIGRMSPIAARLAAASEVVAGTPDEVRDILRKFDAHELNAYAKKAASKAGGQPQTASEHVLANRSAVNDVLESRSFQDRLYDDFEVQYALVADEVKSGSAPRDVVFYSSASKHLETYRIAWTVARSVQVSPERRNRVNALFRVAHPEPRGE